MQNDKKFKEYMTALSEIHRKELSKATVGIYWEILRPFTDDQCIAAFQQAMAENKWIPKPAELVEYIKGTAQVIENKALVIANEIVSHINQEGSSKHPDLKGDPIAIHLMTRRWPYKTWAASILESEIQWWIKQFVEAYQAYRESDVPVPIDAPDEVRKMVENIGLIEDDEAV